MKLLWPRERGAAAILFVLWAFLTTARAFDYKYLGCYKDSATAADLNGQQITLDQNNFDFYQCINECQKMGYPYTGIQNKRKCFCGYTYGRYKTTNACNYTCDNTIPCGGYLANDVFYSVKADSTSESLRDDEVYTTEATFHDARSVCVKYQGDILPILTTSQWTEVKQLLNDAKITDGKVWLGLRKIFDGDTRYSYTDRTKPVFSGSSYSNWISTETEANPCVVVNVADGSWESTSCTAQYPYICHQQPAPDALPTEADPVLVPDDGDSSFDMSKLSLYIVLPLFGFCYGGSCLMYCIHKIYKSLKRKKRQKMLLAKMDELSDGQSPHLIEYEPHNKPAGLAKLSEAGAARKEAELRGAGAGKPPPPLAPPPPPRYEPHPRPQSIRPFSASRRAAVHPIMAPPPPPMFHENEPTPPEPDRPVTTPVEELRMSPRGEPEGEQAKEEPESQQPQTVRDVQIDMPPPKEPTPPPVVSADTVGTAAAAVEVMKPSPDPRSRTQSAKTKAEMRKQKLLNKALKEARERRRKEAEATGATPSPPPSGQPETDQWAQRPKKRSKSPRYGDDPDSGDSTVNLLSDTERGQSLDPRDMSRDPTTMSIQEILRMKVAMNKNRKRPKKPISA